VHYEGFQDLELWASDIKNGEIDIILKRHGLFSNTWNKVKELPNMDIELFYNKSIKKLDFHNL